MTEQEARQRILLAVDFKQLPQAPDFLRLASELYGVKIDQQHQRLPRDKVVSMAATLGVRRVYFDSRFGEGADQMHETIDHVARDGADFVSVAVSVAGRTSLRNAVEASAGRTHIVGLTVSSDMPEEECYEAYGGYPKEVVPRLASIAVEAGLTWVTSSAHEVPQLREYGKTRNLSVIASGIRLSSQDPHDQIRVATPSEAFNNGADIVTIGRPVTCSPDPERALAHIVEDAMLAS